MKPLPMLLGFLLLAPASAAEPAVPGRQIYLDRCASCHGENLEGQPNWMKRKPDGRLPAPPHDASGHTWHHADEQLFVLVRDGPAAVIPGYESDMPGFGDVLEDQEIRDVLEYIKSTWPERQRAIQAARSKRGRTD